MGIGNYGKHKSLSDRPLGVKSVLIPRKPCSASVRAIDHPIEISRIGFEPVDGYLYRIIGRLEKRIRLIGIDA